MKCPAFHVRVYYEDTDAGGVVYYANYLKFAERARTEALRIAGIGQEQLMREEHTSFVVRRCEVEFIRPAKLDDHLTIETSLADIGNASVMMQQTIWRGDERLTVISVKLGIVGEGFRPVRLPAPLRSALLAVFEAT